MRYKEQIFQSASLVIFLGCSCFAIYLVFLLASYSSAIARMERRFEERTFPKMTEMIDQRINLFFNPSLQGLTLLADNLGLADNHGGRGIESRRASFPDESMDRTARGKLGGRFRP